MGLRGQQNKSTENFLSQKTYAFTRVRNPYT